MNCHVCNNPATVKCGGCLKRYYCGNKCATLDWSRNHYCLIEGKRANESPIDDDNEKKLKQFKQDVAERAAALKRSHRAFDQLPLDVGALIWVEMIIERSFTWKETMEMIETESPPPSDLMHALNTSERLWWHFFEMELDDGKYLWTFRLSPPSSVPQWIIESGSKIDEMVANQKLDPAYRTLLSNSKLHVKRFFFWFRALVMQCASACELLVEREIIRERDAWDVDNIPFAADYTLYEVYSVNWKEYDEMVVEMSNDTKKEYSLSGIAVNYSDDEVNREIYDAPAMFGALTYQFTDLNASLIVNSSLSDKRANMNYDILLAFSIWYVNKIGVPINPHTMESVIGVLNKIDPLPVKLYNKKTRGILFLGDEIVD